MKKTRVVYLFVILLSLFALATQAYTPSFTHTDPNLPQKPQKTPGAKATEHALGQSTDPTEQALEQNEAATEQASEQNEAATELASGEGQNPNKPEKTPGAKATEKAAEKGNKLKGKPEHYKGTLQSVDTGAITLEVSGASVTVSLTADTRIHIPGQDNATLQPGLTVMVKARRDENNNLIASSVQVIPGKPAAVHRVGIVTAYTPGESLTLQAQDGNLYTFLLALDLKILPAERADQLAVGALVTVIAPRQPGSPDLTASGLVVHPAGSGAGAFGTDTPAP